MMILCDKNTNEIIKQYFVPKPTVRCPELFEKFEDEIWEEAIIQTNKNKTLIAYADFDDYVHLIMKMTERNQDCLTYGDDLILLFGIYWGMGLVFEIKKMEEYSIAGTA